MNSPAYDIAYYIRNVLAKGTALGTDVLCNFMPPVESGPVPMPANVIAVFQYGGGQSNRGFGNDTAALENSALQVDVRDSDASQAESIAQSIHRSLDELGANVTINGTVYTWLHPLQPPFLLERDKAGRATFVFNLEVQRVRN